MKEKEVPQDDANMMRGKWKDPIYTLDEDGNYTTSYSLGWEVKNAVMQQAWDHVNEKVEKTKKMVLSGIQSPIAYYMEKNMMDVSLLAKYMGLWRWTVKKHLKPKHFKKLPRETLERYAEIFDITAEQLTNLEALKTTENKNE